MAKKMSLQVLGIEEFTVGGKTYRKARVRGLFTLGCFIGPDGRLQAPRAGSRALVEESLSIEACGSEVGTYDVPAVEVAFRKDTGNA